MHAANAALPVAALLALSASGCCSGNSCAAPAQDAAPAAAPDAHTEPWTTTDSGLKWQVVTPGEGERAQWGDAVTVHESTSLEDGTLIFSTWESGDQPISFTLGADQVVDGMEELVADMRVGERRNAIMPPAITKRQRYPDVFGPEDTLHFVVELVATKRPSP